MRILFDHGTPVPWGRHLEGHEEAEAFERGWDRLSNGVLLEEADKTVFEMMITADKNSAINRT